MTSEIHRHDHMKSALFTSTSISSLSPPKPQNTPERQLLDLSQKRIHHPEVNHPENVELEFPEGQIEKDIETNSPYQKELNELEYRPTEKH